MPAGRDLPEPPRRAARRPRPALPARPPVHGVPVSRSASRRIRSATRSRRTCSTAAPTARRPGAAGAREPRYDPDLRTSRPGASRAAYREAHIRGLVATPPMSVGGSLARAGLIVSSAFLVSRSSATSGSSSSPTRSVDRARRVLRGVPHPGPHLPARRGGRPVVGAHPGRRSCSRPTSGAGLAGRVDRHQPDAHRADRLRRRPVHPRACDRADHHARVRGPKLDKTI